MFTKPFSCHSIRFALGIHQSQKEEFYKGSVDDFIYQSGELNGNYVEFMPWRNLSCTFFPKCKGYSRKSDTELWQSYNILLEVKDQSKILCKCKQDSVVSSFLYLDSVFKNEYKLIHNQSPVMNRLCPFLLNLHN